MNILFLSHYHDILGANRSLLSLVEALEIDDIQPHVVIPKSGRFSEKLESAKIACSVLPVHWWVTSNELNFKKKFKRLQEIHNAVKETRFLVRELNIDLIYTNSTVTPVGRVAAWFEGIPHIWHIREFGDLDYALGFIFPKWLCHKFIKSSQGIICNSEAVRGYYFGRSGVNSRTNVIYNGIATKSEFDSLYLECSKRSKTPVYTFLIIGSISPKKGQITALKALSLLKNMGIAAKLILAGSGREEYVQECKQYAIDLGLINDAEFTGYIDQPYDAYLRADCVLMCSEFEAFGRVTAEAMSATLPVIGRNSGGTPEVIADGETGILYNTFDELVDAMALLVRNPELGRQMGLAGWQRAKNLFNIENYAANVYKVIQSVMEKQ